MSVCGGVVECCGSAMASKDGSEGADMIDFEPSQEEVDFHDNLSSEWNGQEEEDPFLPYAEDATEYVKPDYGRSETSKSVFADVNDQVSSPEASATPLSSSDDNQGSCLSSLLCVQLLLLPWSPVCSRTDSFYSLACVPPRRAFV